LASTAISDIKVPQSWPRSAQDRKEPNSVDVSRTVDGDGVATIALSGDVDLVVADGLLGALSEVIDDAATTRVVVDMSRVRFWDSSGVGALVAAYRRASERGTPLVVGEMSEQVRQILHLTGLHQLLTTVGR
jgi:anti-sigma B factor antagonist